MSFSWKQIWKVRGLWWEDSPLLALVTEGDLTPGMWGTSSSWISPQITTSKEMSTSDLKLKGTELCQHPKAGWGKKILPQFSYRNRAWVTSWLQFSETLISEASHAVPRLLTYWNCEIIHLCCFKMLSLWWFAMHE